MVCVCGGGGGGGWSCLCVCGGGGVEALSGFFGEQGKKAYISGELGNKVSKGANIRNRYNQVPHLTQDTI